MKRNLKASVPSYSPIFLEDFKIHICFRVFKEQSDNGYTKHTDTKLKNMYSFYKHVRLISVASLVSNIFSLSLSNWPFFCSSDTILEFLTSQHFTISCLFYLTWYFWIFKQFFSSTVNHFMYVQHLVTTTPFFFF